MTRFFTSDLHFGHRNIIEYCNRPFWQGMQPDVDRMDEALIANWNNTVGDDDEIEVVGDLCMGRLELSLAKAKRLRGKKKLRPGNHDKCHPMYKKYMDYVELYERAGFEILAPHGTDVITAPGGQQFPVQVNHFPHFGESRPSREDRFSGLRPTDDGGWLLCGHVHDAWKVRGRMLNVGVDVWGLRPVSEDEIGALIYWEEQARNV
jgi:calcineurin-like phosphoesterase family protein